MLLPQLLQKHLKFWYVHRLLELHDDVDASLRRHSSNYSNCFILELVVINLWAGILDAPFVRWYALLGHHHFVGPDYPKSSIDIMAQLIADFWQNFLNLLLLALIEYLGESNLLLPNFVLFIYLRQFLGCYLQLWKSMHYISCSLFQRHTNLITNGFHRSHIRKLIRLYCCRPKRLLCCSESLLSAHDICFSLINTILMNIVDAYHSAILS